MLGIPNVDNIPSILVIDDNQNMRDFLNSYLSNFFHVTACSSSSDGLDKINTKTNLVVIDYNIKGQSGLDFLRKIKSNELYSHIPVIFLSEDNESNTRVRGLECGASDFITKPFNPEELKVRISNLVIDLNNRSRFRRIKRKNRTLFKKLLVNS